MKKLLFVFAFLVIAGTVYSQDVPTYTPNYSFRKWAEGAHPTADSLNQNWTDIDYWLKAVENKADQIRDYEINGHALTGNIDLTPADIGVDTTDFVPVTRTINGHALSSNISLDATDIGVDVSNFVPTSRTINGKALSGNITLTALDVGVDLSGYVPTTRTVNGKALSGNVSLVPSDIGLGNVKDYDQTNADNITSGTLALARLPTTVWTTTNLDTSLFGRRAGTNTYTANNTYTGTNLFDGNTRTKALYSAPVTISAAAIDWSLGNVFNKTTTTGHTFTFSNLTAGQIITVNVTYGGSHSITFSNSNLRWPGNTAPTPTATSGKTDVFTFEYDGTYIYGTYAQNYTTP